MENKEVELIDYLNVIWKRRGLILGGVFVCMVMAGGVSFLIPKVYETGLDLRLGQIYVGGTGKVIPVDNAYGVIAIINSEPFLNQVKKKAGLTPSPHELKQRKIITAKAVGGERVASGQIPVLVHIVTKGETPQDSVELIETVADLIIQEHNVYFVKLMRELKGYEKELEGQLEVIEDEIQKLAQIINGQRTNPATSAPAVILLQAQLEQKQTHLVGLFRELRDLKIFIVRSENTRVAFPPVVPDEYVHPKHLSIVLIAGIVALIASLLLAFFLEYLEKVKGREGFQKETK